jgi:hypothetical protein
LKVWVAKSAHKRAGPASPSERLRGEEPITQCGRMCDWESRSSPSVRRSPRDAWSQCRARISEVGCHASGKAAAAAVVAGWLPCLLNATIVHDSDLTDPLQGLIATLGRRTVGMIKMNGQIESNTAIEAGLSATSADVLNARRGKRSAGLRPELLLIPSGARYSSGPSHKLSKPASTSLLVASGVNDERISRRARSERKVPRKTRRVGGRTCST